MRPVDQQEHRRHGTITILAPRYSSPFCTAPPLLEAWEEYEEDPSTATILSSGDTASPSTDTVYEVDLEDPLVQVPVEITTAGAYALFVEHGSGEVSVVVTSPLGVVLTAGASEGVDEEEDDESSGATSSQWGSAIVASVIVSLCR